jgi:hypothetical protein
MTYWNGLPTMTDMTLEQVRDWHRKMSLAHGYWSAQRAHEKMADAIDAAIKAQGEPVAWHLRIGDSDDWGISTSEELADFYGKQSGLKYEKEPLYTAPPTADRPTWEEVRRMIVLAVDWGYDEGFARANDEDAPAIPIDDKCDRIIAEFRKRCARL